MPLSLHGTQVFVSAFKYVPLAHVQFEMEKLPGGDHGNSGGLFS
jgi:hypothetical protein